MSRALATSLGILGWLAVAIAQDPAPTEAPIDVTALRAQAEQGDAVSQWRLGTLYEMAVAGAVQLRPRRGLWTLTPLWTHASTSGLENCSAVSHKRPQPSSSSIQSLKNTVPSSSYPSTPGQVSALSNGQRH